MSVVDDIGRLDSGPAGATYFCRRRLLSWTCEHQYQRLSPHPRPPDRDGDGDATHSVTALYDAHAVPMIRIALVMLGDRAAAEDVVQDAFFGLYRRWPELTDQANAVAYVRSAVFNGCRDALRRQARSDRRDRATAWSWQDAGSAEAAALLGEDRRRILAAVRRLPDRQREALVSGTTWKCPRKKRPAPWTSAAAPSSPPRRAQSLRSAAS